MYKDFQSHLKTELTSIKKAGLYKEERVITSPQRADITVQGGKQVLNFCANNYLGLSDNKRLIEATPGCISQSGELNLPNAAKKPGALTKISTGRDIMMN